MGLPRQLVGEVRRLNESQLRHLLILARGLLLESEVPVVEISDIPGMPSVRYRQRSVSCGKATCRACPHGPYWYAHWTEDGRKRSRYIGSELPTAVRHKLDALDADRARRLTGPARAVEQPRGDAPPASPTAAPPSDARPPAHAAEDGQGRATMAATGGGEADHPARTRLRLIRGD